MLAALKRFHATTLSGLHRWPKDGFALFGRLAGGEWKQMAQPWSQYRADPFLWPWQGQLWVFFEEFEYLKNKGRLAACRLDGSDYAVVLEQPYHLSYPFLLEYQKRLYMVPESCANQTVDLYECVDFPQRWRKVCTLIEGLDGADATLLWENERWWMFVSVRPESGGQRHLEIYSRTELIGGDWIAHPINSQRLYSQLCNQSGRSGGSFFRRDQAWIRPAQFSPDYYGQGLSFRRLQTLNLEHFEELGVDLPDLPWRQNHHLSLWGEHQWINRKIRVSYTASPRALERPWLGP